ncbi:MAG: hypothetical protein HY747_07880 [Elusimicrobia bacterium]|nr:hypothetical protein [Elusimicrobiota bacterium]
MTKEQLKLYCEAEFENIEKVLLQINAVVKPEKEYSAVDLAAIATFIHNVYNGIENILKRILVYEGLAPKDSAVWHKDLLKESLAKGVIPDSLYGSLLEYLSFRHFFVHSYVFVLKWDSLKPLVKNIGKVFETFKHSAQSRIEA